MPRIEPLSPPYEPEVDAQLRAMMPPGTPPILLFRTFVRNLAMTRAMSGWGAYELGRTLSLTMRDREIVVDRTCARLGCEYEWGVHVAFFADRVALDEAQIRSLTHGTSNDPCWTEPRDRLLLDTVDALCATATIDDELCRRLTALFEPSELLDLFMLCGWYHAIGFTANAAGVDLEDSAPRFVDYA